MNALELTEELTTLIQHLEAARAAEKGIALQFTSHSEVESYRRKLYAAKRKIKDSGQGDFSDIMLRISSEDESLLLLIKEKI